MFKFALQGRAKWTVLCTVLRQLVDQVPLVRFFFQLLEWLLLVLKVPQIEYQIFIAQEGNSKLEFLKKPKSALKNGQNYKTDTFLQDYSTNPNDIFIKNSPVLSSLVDGCNIV